MAVTELIASVNIHQTLSDEPNDVGGLTPAQLKLALDTPANTIKDYINHTLIPTLDGLHLPLDYASAGGQTVKEAMDGIVLGQIQDGSIGQNKLSCALSDTIDAKADAGEIYSKDQSLTPATAALYGLTSAAVPDDVLATLAQTLMTDGSGQFVDVLGNPAVIPSAQLDSRLQIGVGSYAGNGATSKSLTFPAPPKLLIVSMGSNPAAYWYSGFGVYIQGMSYMRITAATQNAATLETTREIPAAVSGTTTLTWTTGVAAARLALNESGYTYHYAYLI